VLKSLKNLQITLEWVAMAYKWAADLKKAWGRGETAFYA
jgi:hypothetical protein